MLKTCYGLCSLRTGVKIVAFYELICTILFFLAVFVYDMYNKIYLFYGDVNVYYFIQSCVIIITLLKLFSSMSLMQATIQNAPYKIFVWIVIVCIVYLTTFIVLVKLYVHKVYVVKLVAESAILDPVTEWHLLAFIVIINIVSVIEFHVVASYYEEEKRAERHERMQNIMMSLNNHHRVDVFGGVNFTGSSAAGPEELSFMSNLTSFRELLQQPVQCV